MISRFLGAGVLALLCVSALPDTASAQRAYDGNWSVLIVTQNGSCDRAYRYGVSIRNGGVHYDGGVVSFTGRVAANGAVSVRVSSGSAFANGTGTVEPPRGPGPLERPVRRQPLFRLLDGRTARITPSRNPAISRPAADVSRRNRSLCFQANTITSAADIRSPR